MARHTRVEQEEKLGTADIERYLDGMAFPAERDEIVGYAQDTEVPDEVVTLLDSLPDRRYSTADDVSRAIGQMRAGG